MPQISTIVRNFVIDRMLDATNGFNYWLSEVASGYPNAGGAFTLVKGTNLFLGQMTHDTMLATANTPSYPLVIIYSTTASTPSLIPGTNITPAEFSGPVGTRMHWYSGFLTNYPPPDPDSVLDMIEDAMLETFNKQDYYDLTPAGTLYNNEMAEQRGALAQGGPNWIQLARWDIIYRQVSYA